MNFNDAHSESDSPKPVPKVQVVTPFGPAYIAPEAVTFVGPVKEYEFVEGKQTSCRQCMFFGGGIFYILDTPENMKNVL